MNVTTSNIGDAAANGSTTRLYLVPASQSSPRVLRGQTTVLPLAAGASVLSAVTVTIPKTQAAGNYVFRACADDLRQVVEESDTNNCGTPSVALRVLRADLVITDVSLHGITSVARGGGLTVTATLKNQGDLVAQASEARFYLGAGATRKRTDTRLSLMPFPVLLPGLSQLGTTTLPIPTTQLTLFRHRLCRRHGRRPGEQRAEQLHGVLRLLRHGAARRRALSVDFQRRGAVLSSPAPLVPPRVNLKSA